MAILSWFFRSISEPSTSSSRKWGSPPNPDSPPEDELETVARHTNGYYSGIINISGTYCYMNSVLQAFASLPSLAPYIDLVQSRAVSLDVPTPLIDSLKSFLQDLNTPSSFMRRPLHPAPIIDGISLSPATQRRSRALLGSREHQDAQELFQLLSEGLSGEAAGVRKEDVDHNAGMIGVLPRESSSTPPLHQSEQPVPLASPFDGLTATRRSCIVCGYTDAVIHYPFDNWQLPLPTMTAAVTVEAVLGDFMRLEVLQDCTCRKCSLLMTLDQLKSRIQELEDSTPPIPYGLSLGKTSSSTLPNGTPVDVFDNKFKTLSESPPSEKDRGSSSKKKRKKNRNPAQTLDTIRHAYETLAKALQDSRIEDDFPDVEVQKVTSRFSTRQTVLARAPQILSLHMNRSIYTAYGATRNPIRVYFPEVLDMTNFISLSGALPLEMRGDIGMCLGGDNPPGLVQKLPASQAKMIPLEERTIYRLSAVICHYGAHSFGHYVCYRRKPDGLQRPPRIVGVRAGEEEVDELGRSSPKLVWEDRQEDDERSGRGWLRASDASVREIGLKDVLMEAAGSCFLVFYEKASWHVSPNPTPSAATDAKLESGSEGGIPELLKLERSESAHSIRSVVQGRVVRSTAPSKTSASKTAVGKALDPSVALPRGEDEPSGSTPLDAPISPPAIEPESHLDPVPTPSLSSGTHSNPPSDDEEGSRSLGEDGASTHGNPPNSPRKKKAKKKKRKKTSSNTVSG